MPDAGTFGTEVFCLSHYSENFFCLPNLLNLLLMSHIHLQHQFGFERPQCLQNLLHFFFWYSVLYLNFLFHILLKQTMLLNKSS